jgi:osmotically-inducible protein OsmY
LSGKADKAAESALAAKPANDMYGPTGVKNRMTIDWFTGGWKWN